ncbi:tumor necrosis factor receptor family protein [Paraburkholderia heleia]|uniref:hypothetical protein n=1 Tax=Paraburkholderia heleia TaxID=634127 RepID=UPI002AB61232|nr:hypothetical protein [Paraburkholderia heleia]
MPYLQYSDCESYIASHADFCPNCGSPDPLHRNRHIYTDVELAFALVMIAALATFALAWLLGKVA